MTVSVVRAAGGVVYRPRRDGVREVAVIHRPRYDDWTLPKGKLDPGETLEEAAIREVREETGFRTEIERRIGEAAYRDRHGRPKRVTYYAMRPVKGRFRKNDEVDELRWLTIDEAERLLSYGHDRNLVRQVAERPPL
ncbi:MAG: NUDIX hydrolase [Actinobacteria bacterium]|nr:MAG: NUDIX hydrolase [Actinomycetota bacterium]